MSDNTENENKALAARAAAEVARRRVETQRLVDQARVQQMSFDGKRPRINGGG